MRARHPTSAMPKPSLQPFQVMWWPVLMWLVAGWDEVMWLVVDVMPCHLMRCVTLLLCYVTWCNAMSCDVLSCDELSSAVKWCDAVGWGLVRLWRNVAGCDVTLCGSKWLCDVMTWQMIWWSVLQRPTILQTTTRYYFGFGSWWNHVWTVFGSCSNRPPLLVTLHPFSALFFQKKLGCHFWWQAQYLLTLDGEVCCSAQCTWRFMCDEDQSWDLFFIALQYLVTLEDDACCSPHCTGHFMCEEDQS